MQNWDVVNILLDYVPTINFDSGLGDISLFETTIRYLGGMVSGECQWPGGQAFAVPG